MALIKCKECSKEISSSAKECKYCGYPIDEKRKEKNDSKTGILYAVLGTVAIIIVILINNGIIKIK